MKIAILSMALALPLAGCTKCNTAGMEGLTPEARYVIFNHCEAKTHEGPTTNWDYLEHKPSIVPSHTFYSCPGFDHWIEVNDDEIKEIK